MVLATLIHLPPSKILSHMVELWSRDVAVYGVQHAHSASGMNNKSLRSASNIKDTDCSRIVRHTISWLLCWCMQNDILSINCFLYTVIDWIQASSILSNVRQTQLLFIVEACQFPSNQAPRRDDTVNLFPVVLWLLGRPLGFTISYYIYPFSTYKDGRLVPTRTYYILLLLPLRNHRSHRSNMFHLHPGHHVSEVAMPGFCPPTIDPPATAMGLDKKCVFIHLKKG
jgi:hypothetical protein